MKTGLNVNLNSKKRHKTFVVIVTEDTPGVSE